MFGGMKRSLLLLPFLLAACVPSTQPMKTLSLSAPALPTNEKIKVEDKFTLGFTQDVLYNAFTDVGANLRVAPNWDNFKRVDYLQNYSVAWEAVSSNGLGAIQTAVKLVPVGNGYIQAQFTSNGNLAADDIHALHALIVAEVKSRM